MEGSGEKLPKIEVIASDFDAHASEQVARFNGLSDFLTESLHIVKDLPLVNITLQACDRADLAIAERAEVLAIEKPEDVIEQCSNFPLGFRMQAESAEPVEEDQAAELVPMTKEEVFELRRLPKIISYQQLEQADDSGDVKLPHNAYLSHVVRPAFLRMLVLFPDFTKDLVAKISNLESRNRELRFEPELFVAYQLMSRLIDTNDVPDGKPDSWYLCH